MRGAPRPARNPPNRRRAFRHEEDRRDRDRHGCRWLWPTGAANRPDVLFVFFWRKQIQIVGSSTVFPFTTAVSEQFARTTGVPAAPVVESTGTGRRLLRLFCGGIGEAHPDFTGASRAMTETEYKHLHRERRRQHLQRMLVGYDGHS